jgi:hypothetical protein
MMAYTFHWLDGQHLMPSDAALQKAEQSMGRYCASKGLHPYEMQLMDESAPDAKNPHWRFRFQSDRNNRVTVEVAQNGSTRLLSGVTD